MNRQLSKFSWYLTPALSVVLSLPTLLGCITLWALVTYELLARDMKGTLLLAVWHWLPSSWLAWLVLYSVFGPLFACVLCAGQLARSRQASTLVDEAGSQLSRVTRAALLFTVVSSCLLLLSVGIAFALRGPT